MSIGKKWFKQTDGAITYKNNIRLYKRVTCNTGDNNVEIGYGAYIVVLSGTNYGMLYAVVDTFYNLNPSIDTVISVNMSVEAVSANIININCGTPEPVNVNIYEL